MADRLTAQDRSPNFLFLGVDAIAFWIRNQAMFWMTALPIAAFAAIAAWMFAADRGFSPYRDHWGWDLLFALIYAMFLDRWMKQTLLDDASPCEEVDDLRRALVSFRLLALAASFCLLAMALRMLQIQGIEATLAGWGLPYALSTMLAIVLRWLPHVLVWSMLLGRIVLTLPTWSAVAPLSFGEAYRLGRPFRTRLFALVFGAALFSLVAHAATTWGVQVLPDKPWAPAAMAAALRLADCLMLAFVGYVLAALWRDLTDWRAPEPDDHFFRDTRLRPRRAI